MTHKEVIQVTFIPYEYQILRKAHDFAEDNLDADTLPEELYTLLEQLLDVTNKLMNMSADN